VPVPGIANRLAQLDLRRFEGQRHSRNNDGQAVIGTFLLTAYLNFVPKVFVQGREIPTQLEVVIRIDKVKIALAAVEAPANGDFIRFLTC
jgi:hypothetical protein